MCDWLPRDHLTTGAEGGAHRGLQSHRCAAGGFGVAGAPGPRRRASRRSSCSHPQPAGVHCSRGPSPRGACGRRPGSAGTRRRIALKQYDFSCRQDETASAAMLRSFPSGAPAGSLPQKMRAAFFSHHRIRLLQPHEKLSPLIFCQQTTFQPLQSVGIPCEEPWSNRIHFRGSQQDCNGCRGTVLLKPSCCPCSVTCRQVPEAHIWRFAAFYWACNIIRNRGTTALGAPRSLKTCTCAWPQVLRIESESSTTSAFCFHPFRPLLTTVDGRGVVRVINYTLPPDAAKHSLDARSIVNRFHLARGKRRMHQRPPPAARSACRSSGLGSLCASGAAHSS